MKFIQQIICFLAVSFATSLQANEDVKTSAYVSLRAGFDYIDSGNNYDATNGRDFLSRAGIKASQALDYGLTGTALVEYGERGDNKVDFKQNQGPGLRRIQIGIKNQHHSLTFGSQTLIWHKYVRSAYFSDGNDTLRQGGIRDDDLIQYQYQRGTFQMAASLHVEAQDGDSLDQLQLAAQYQVAQIKMQLAISQDRRGDNTGNLFGSRIWWQQDALTLSAFYHLAEKDYDLYAGSSSGNVRITEAATDGSVAAVPTCLNEERNTAGLYASYRYKQHQIHARYANEHCKVSGDVSSNKIEYVHFLSKNYRVWLSAEQLDNDKTRRPVTTSQKSMAAYQLGLRMDF